MYNIFSQNLKYLRESKNCTQEKLAKDLNLSRGIISLWENGLREPTMSSLNLLADYFDVSIDYLVGRTPY